MYQWEQHITITSNGRRAPGWRMTNHPFRMRTALPAFPTITVPGWRLGGQYKAQQASAVDFGYAHLFVKDSTINSAGRLVGTYKNKVDILSVQYTQNF